MLRAHWRLHIRLALYLLMLMPLVIRSALAQDSPKRDEYLSFLVTASRAHQDSFPFLQSRFELTTAMAQNLNKGMEGEWLETPPPAVCDVFWAFNGEVFRRDEVYSPETVATFERKQGNLWVRAYSTRLAIWNPNIEIFHAPGSSFRIGQAGTNNLESYQLFNVGMGDSFHRRVEEFMHKDAAQVRYTGDRDFRGRASPVIEFSQTISGVTQVDYFWIDLDHGYLPVRIETYIDNKEKLAMLTEVQEFLDVGQNRWVPKLYRYVKANVVSGPVRCREVRLEYADADTPPAEAMFELTVSPGTTGTSLITGSQFKSKTGRVSLTDFRDDGTVRVGQVNLEAVAASAAASHHVASGPISLGAEQDSEVPLWPFGSTKRTVIRFVIRVALTLGLVSLLITIAVRKWLRTS